MARALAIHEVVEAWLLERLQGRLRLALARWAARAAQGALRRRGGRALRRFLNLSRLRRVCTAWRATARRLRRRARGVSRGLPAPPAVGLEGAMALALSTVYTWDEGQVCVDEVHRRIVHVRKKGFSTVNVVAAEAVEGLSVPLEQDSRATDMSSETPVFSRLPAIS